jgi:hypothetical protein
MGPFWRKGNPVSSDYKTNSITKKSNFGSHGLLNTIKDFEGLEAAFTFGKNFLIKYSERSLKKEDGRQNRRNFK